MKKILACLLALMLTGSLALFAGSLACSWTLGPAMEKGGILPSDAVAARQKELIRAKITKLAGLYGFSAEPVLAAVDDETLRGLNTQAAAWWSDILRDGMPGKDPETDTKAIENILRGDAFLNGLDEADANMLVREATNAVSQSVLRTVLPVRPQIVSKGLTEVGKRVVLPSLVTFFFGVPGMALALSALLAGLIALLESKKLRLALPYIGSAMGAAVLVLAGCLVLIPVSGLLPLLKEASLSLDVQAGAVLSAGCLRLGILACALLAGCVLCLALCRKTGKKHEA